MANVKEPTRHMRELCAVLGDKYCIVRLFDDNWVLFRDFHNGFCISITGANKKYSSNYKYLTIHFYMKSRDWTYIKYFSKRVFKKDIIYYAKVFYKASTIIDDPNGYIETTDDLEEFVSQFKPLVWEEKNYEDRTKWERFWEPY